MLRSYGRSIGANLSNLKSLPTDCTLKAFYCCIVEQGTCSLIRRNLPSREFHILTCYSSYQSTKVEGNMQEKILSRSLKSHILALGSNKNWSEVINLLEHADLNGNKVTIGALREAIDVMSQCGQPKYALRILKKIECINKPAPIFALNCVVKAYANIFDWEHAEMFLSKMETKGYMPEVSTYNIVLSSYVKGGYIDKATELLEKMRHNNLAPDRTSYNTAINICAKNGNIEKIREFFEEMKEHDIKPDIITYSSSLDACSKAKNYDYALELFSEMKKNNIIPNIISWNRLIDALGKSGNFELALENLNEMIEAGIKPNCITYNCLIDSCDGDYNRAKYLYVRMQEEHIHPTLQTYTAVLKAIRKSGDVHEIANLCEDMAKYSLTPNIITYNSMLKAYASHNDISAMLKCLNSMMNAQIQPNLVIWNIVFNALHDSNELNTADELYLSILNSNNVNPYKTDTGMENCTAVLDLHTFGVGIALAAVRKGMQDIIATKEGILGVITGWGNHGGKSIVKEKVLEMLENTNVLYKIDSDNEGRIRIYFSNAKNSF